MLLRFVGPVVEWRGPAPYYYVVLPEDASADVQEVASRVTYGWGAIPVEARIAQTRFTTSLFPKDGRYLLPLKDAVRRPLALAVDDRVSVELRLRLA